MQDAFSVFANFATFMGTKLFFFDEVHLVARSQILSEILRRH